MKKNMKKALAVMATAAVLGCFGMTAFAEEGPVAAPHGNGVPLIVYSNGASDGRGDWIKEKAAEYGFDIEFVAAGGGEIQSRLIAEKESPICDVIYGLQAANFEALKSEGLLVQYEPAWVNEIDEALRDADGYYYCVDKQAILLVYDKNQVSDEEAPKQWSDLWTNEAYSGTYEFASSLTGATPRNLIGSILYHYADPEGDLNISEEGWAQIEAYYANGVPSEPDVDVYAQISDPDSEVLYGTMWSGGVQTRDEQYGVETGYAVPEIGLPFVSSGLAIVEGSDNVEEAKLFIDWLGSAEIYGAFAEAFPTIPANNYATDNLDEFNKTLSEIPVEPVDWAFIGENIDSWVEKIELTYMP